MIRIKETDYQRVETIAKICGFTHPPGSSHGDKIDPARTIEFVLNEYERLTKHGDPRP